MGKAWSSLSSAPQFTEKQLADQSGKVFIVTGSTSGLGRLLIGILYQRNAKVYIAARSETKAYAAIDEIKREHPDSTGELVYLHLDLNDLTTIKASADKFLSKESRLDVLWNNAAVMVPPQGSKSAQGYELQIGTNNLAPFLFTELLRPIMKQTAQTAPKNSVRVVWVSSSAAELAPTPVIDFSNMDYKREEGIWPKYNRSKAGNVLHSVEFARRTKGQGIISLSLNPGFYMTNLQKTMPRLQKTVFRLVTKDPRFGAYTELFAGLHPGIKEEHNGGWIVPFGKHAPVPAALVDPELGRKYWEWTEEQVRPYR
jgi:NAD(P)-dependent dehydrogenase (short-subunit alcohol dehydrogenase family)